MSATIPSPASSTSSSAVAPTSTSSSGNTNAGPPTSGSSEGWSCGACTYLNHSGSRRCEICSELSPFVVLQPAPKRPLGIEHAARGAMGMGSSLDQALASSRQVPSLSSSSSSSSPAVPEGKHSSLSSSSLSSHIRRQQYMTGVEWCCKNCSGLNPPKAMVCQHCYTARPERTADEKAADEAARTAAEHALGPSDSWVDMDDDDFNHGISDDDKDGHDGDDDNDDDDTDIYRPPTPDDAPSDDELDPIAQVAALGVQGRMLSPEEARYAGATPASSSSSSSSSARRGDPFDPNFFQRPSQSLMEAASGRDLDPAYYQELIDRAHLNRSSGGSSNNRGSAAAAVATEPWTCAMCTLSNLPLARRCAVCNAPRAIQSIAMHGGSTYGTAVAQPPPPSAAASSTSLSSFSSSASSSLSSHRTPTAASLSSHPSSSSSTSVVTSAPAAAAAAPTAAATTTTDSLPPPPPAAAPLLPSTDSAVTLS